MSYFSPTDNFYFSAQNFTDPFVLTPMNADIVAMQNLYGLSTTTRTGNTTYGFNSNAGRDMFNASLYPDVAYTIVDSGGTDTLDYSGFSNNQLINLNPETFMNVGSNVGNVMIARGVTIENAIGGSGSDAITGNAVANTLTGNGGNDTINGAAGADTMIGGSGNDTLTGGSGDDIFRDSIAGHNGDTISDLAAGDTIVFTDATLAGFSFTLTGNTLTYTGGSLTLQGPLGGQLVASAAAGGGVQLSLAAQTGPTEGDDTLNGTELADQLNGLGGNDTISGLGGNDTLDGGTGADTMAGGLGDDTYVVDNAADVVTENPGEGTDLVNASISYTLGANLENLTLTGSAALNGTGNAAANVLRGNAAANVLDGSGGDDTLAGNGGNDTLIGGAGNDSLNGGAGGGAMSGGIGNDTFTVDTVGDTVSENAGEGTDTVVSSIDYTLGANVENLSLTRAARVGTGNALANAIRGTSGDDTLDGGAGADKLYGGAGNDTYIVDTSSDRIAETAGGGTDTVLASSSYTISWDIENLTLTGSSAISGTGNNLDNVLTGNDAANTLNGLAGNDTLIGNGGNDWLDGGTGADSMAGGLGNDTYTIDNVLDSVTENAGEGTDLVRSSISTTLGANVENLTLLGSASIDGTGNALANTIRGTSGNNILDGGAGADKMYGGAGDDTYVVDNAGDGIAEAAGGGTDTALASISYTLAANVENLTLTGSSAIDGTGNALDNVITGNSAANTLSGNGGNDTLIGGAGTDHMTGGAGNDLFVFANGDFGGATAGSADEIVDFTSGQDKIDLSAVDANSLLGADQAFAFIGTAAFSNTAGELRYEQISGNTYLSGDTNGDGIADFMVKVDGSHVFTGADFGL